MNSSFSFSNSLIIKNIPRSIFKNPILEIPPHTKLEIETKKWISFSDIESSKNIKIYSPTNGDQCWGIEPPCTFSNYLLKE